jgi:hypothetical protein
MVRAQKRRQGTGKRGQGSLRGIIAFFEQSPFAPFLLSIQPILYLFSINLGELSFSEVLRSLLVSLFFVCLTLGAVYLLLRDWTKAGLVASLFIFLFFLFGDASDWTAERLGLGPARADALVLVILAASVLGWTWLVAKRIQTTSMVNLYFNVLALVLFLYTGFQVGRYLLENQPASVVRQPAQVAALGSTPDRPDVYYIVLDGYGRQDILQALYEFDNSAFLQGLADRGFYIADQSSSNYIQTMLSLSSSFNMDYLQALKTQGFRLENRGDLINLLENNRVREIFAQQGYQLVSFHNEYKATIASAEIYYQGPSRSLASPVTAFESIVVDHTLARILSYVPAFNRALIEMPYDTHRAHILSTFSTLKEVPSLNGNYLVYAHIIAPHPPFVFDEEGNVVPQDKPFSLNDANYYRREHSQRSYLVGYRRQIQYVNTLVLETIDAILARSAHPPIIILQGDHGPGAYLHWGSLDDTLPAERFGILNAYYFPDQDYSRLYPDISPVNTFRVVFNQYFSGDYALLPDRHYYSSWSFPFDFVEVTDVSLPR